jgi:hypothetical protein
MPEERGQVHFLGDVLQVRSVLARKWTSPLIEGPTDWNRA